MEFPYDEGKFGTNLHSIYVYIVCQREDLE